MSIFTGPASALKSEEIYQKLNVGYFLNVHRFNQLHVEYCISIFLDMPLMSLRSLIRALHVGLLQSQLITS